MAVREQKLKEAAMRRWLMIVACSVLTAACAGIDVERDYDTSVNFRAFDTYAWQPRKETENSLLDSRVHDAVDRVLAGKGYRKVAKDNADLLVSYRYGVAGEDEPNRVHTSVGLGGGSRGTFGGIGVSIGLGRDREKSILGIDMVNPGTGKLLWRGVARQRPIERSSPEKTTANVNETVAEILKAFPPEPEAGR